MTTREIVRANRRKQITQLLSSIRDFEILVSTVESMPAHLRATCVLDIEEFICTSDIELQAMNSWWSNFNVPSLYKEFKARGLL